MCARALYEPPTPKVTDDSSSRHYAFMIDRGLGVKPPSDRESWSVASGETSS